VERHLAARAMRLPAEIPGEIVAILALADVTANRRGEQMRADFIANVSHELRTPLASLIGFIETLRGPARDDPAAHARFLAIMHDQAARMSRLVSDLLSLSRIELDEHRPPTGHVDLARVLAAVSDALRPQAAERGIKIVLDLAADLPAVPGDEDQLAQVFQNLVVNAIQYAGANTEVTMRAHLASPAPNQVGGPGGAIAVAVIDRGEGIERRHLPRLTERFYRVDAARSRAVGGTGLGLAIVKHVMSRHRGALAIESEPGKGSTFTVYLPVAQSEIALGPARAAAVTKP
jgi:two-component system phosphate regulon sensor histidine kinase PhoR